MSDEKDEAIPSEFGSTAWLIREARTAATLTADQGMEYLRLALDRYDEHQDPAAFAARREQQIDYMRGEMIRGIRAWRS